MNEDFQHTAVDSYIQNDGDPHSRSVKIELSANVTSGSVDSPEDSICIRMLDAEAVNHHKSHIGVIISPEVARSFARWLLDAADLADNSPE